MNLIVVSNSNCVTKKCNFRKEIIFLSNYFIQNCFSVSIISSLKAKNKFGSKLRNSH